MAHNVGALCRCGIRIPSARNRCPAFDKDKYLESMFGDVGSSPNKCRYVVDADCYNLKPHLHRFVLCVRLSAVSFVQLIQVVLQCYSFLKLFLVIGLHLHQLNYCQRLRICAVGILTNCPPGTEAKLITKSRS